MSFGFLRLASLALLVPLVPAFLVAGCRRWSEESQRRSQRLLPPALRGIAILQYAGFCFFTLAFAYNHGALGVLPVVLVVLLGALLATYLAQSPTGRWRCFPAFLLAYGCLGAWQIICLPTPSSIDVWVLQQQGDGFLLRGQNPYASEYAPQEAAVLYGPSVVANGHIQTFPYPPLQLLLTLPGYAVGDVRWATLAALLGMAALMGALGRGGGSSTGDLPHFAAVLLLCNPVNFYILDRGWTEPLLCLGMGICGWAVATRRGMPLVLGLAAVIGVKQYGVLATLPFWAFRRGRWQAVATAGALALAVTLPFVVWNPQAFWRGVVQFHTESAYRENSLSVLAAVAVYTGYWLPAVTGFAAAVVVALLARVGRPQSLAQAIICGAAVLLAFFLFGKAGHLNYYWLVGSLLPLALAASAGDPPRRFVNTQAQTALPRNPL
jgi:hypothetical protein